jgi:uncharacterized protein (TIGR00369 family)
MADNAALVTLAKSVLAAQPFSALIGAELVAISEGSAELFIPYKAELCQHHGFIHGGVLSYAADNCITFAGGSVLGAASVTAEYKINYVRPAMGSGLRAKAQVISRGKRQVVCSCEISIEKDGESKLCAIALGTVSAIEPAIKPAG